jgi:hypothetical protein
MALSERVSLRGIHREIRSVARRLRLARRRADAAYHAQLDALMRQLGDMDTRTSQLCTRTFGVWPPPPATPKPTPQPGPRKPGKPKKGGGKPAPPKKGR